MKTVLYVTDFSKNSQKALEYAYEVCTIAEAKLIALHVFDIPTIMSSPLSEPTFQEIERDVERIARDKLKNFCETHLTKDAVKQNIHFEVREDKSVVHGIVEMITDHTVDLVVMGTKGASKFRELLLGSTTKGVIKNAICPVLVVPEDSNYRGFREIVYATDLEENDIEAIQSLTKIASAYKAEINIIHISTKHEYAGSEKMEWFKELVKEHISYPHKKFELILSDTIYEGLNNCLNEGEVDLLVMLEHDEKSIFDKLFHRDLVKRMAFHTTVPLLSYNKKTLKHLSKEEKAHELRFK